MCVYGCVFFRSLFLPFHLFTVSRQWPLFFSSCDYYLFTLLNTHLIFYLDLSISVNKIFVFIFLPSNIHSFVSFFLSLFQRIFLGSTARFFTHFVCFFRSSIIRFFSYSANKSDIHINEDQQDDYRSFLVNQMLCDVYGCVLT